MNQKQINRILKKYKELFDALENYDKTGKLNFIKKSKIKSEKPNNPTTIP